MGVVAFLFFFDRFQLGVLSFTVLKVLANH